MTNRVERPGASTSALLVCDDTDEMAVLSLVLQRVGYTAMPTSDLDKVLRAWSQRPAAMVILALRQNAAPDQVRLLRRTTDVPLTVITDPVAEDTLCQILETGADQVILRPFSARLLMMQLRALLRRCQGDVVVGLPSLRAGRLTLDPATRTAQVEGRGVARLTQLEFRLLYTLMLHQGQTLTVETIVERVWGYGGEGSTVLVRGLVSRLRAKIESDSHNPQFVLTVPGVGYRLRTAQEQM